MLNIEYPRELDIDDQILILSEIDWKEMIQSKLGLCDTLCITMERLFELNPYDIRINDLEKYIPIFSRINARMFGADTFSSYWWHRDSEGYEKRRQFISWMLEELCKQAIN